MHVSCVILSFFPYFSPLSFFLSFFFGPSQVLLFPPFYLFKFLSTPQATIILFQFHRAFSSRKSPDYIQVITVFPLLAAISTHSEDVALRLSVNCVWDVFGDIRPQDGPPEQQ
jgi:hypothetical protein